MPMVMAMQLEDNGAWGVGTLSTSQHFCFCRPFSSHKTLTLLTMGNPPIWATSWRTGGRVWQSLQKCRLWACLFFWTGGREGLLVVDTIFLFWFWTFLYFKSHNSDSSCWWQPPSVSPPLPWRSLNPAFPSGWWTPYSEFDLLAHRGMCFNIVFHYHNELIRSKTRIAIGSTRPKINIVTLPIAYQT